MNTAPHRPRRFAILTVARTGSNMLCTMLNSHPDVLCHHEIFNANGIFYALNYRLGGIHLGTIEERDRDPLLVYERIWQEHLGHRAVGFKLTDYQNEPVLRAVLADSGVAKIVLRRNNRVKPYVSWLISERLNQWEVYRHEELIVPRPQVNVSVAGLLENIRFADRYFTEIEASLRGSGQIWLSVTYERLFDNAERQRLLDFLEVRPSLDFLRIESVKQNPTDLRQTVANFESLRAALQGSDLESQLLDRGI